MKKTLIALPIVAGAAAAAVAGTSQIAGNLTQDEYQKLLVKLNEMTPFVFENEEYESGLGTSSAVTKVLKSEEADAEVLFRLQHDINHTAIRMDDDGVAIGTVKIDTTLHDSTELPPEFAAVMTDDVPFTLNTVVDMGGDLSNALRLTGAEFEDEGTTVTWSGMDIEIVTKDNNTVGNGSLGKMSVQDAATGADLNFDNSLFELDIETFGDLIYTGTGQIALNDVSLASPELPAPVAIENVSISAGNDIEGENMDSTVVFNIDGIDTIYPIKKASLEVSVEDMLVEGLRQYNRKFGLAMFDAEAMQDESEFAKEMADAFRGIIKPGTGLEYKVALANDGGDVDANLRVGVKTDGDVSADTLENITTARDLFNILAVNGALDADTAALSQTPLIFMLGAAGDFLTVTDESIKSDVTLNGTTLIVNGVELPLEAFAGGMLDAPLSSVMPTQ